MPSPSTSRSSTSTVKLLIAVIGIWFSFIYYGSLQEDITSYTSSSGAKFTTPWFLQLIEASACVLVGAVGAALLFVFSSPAPTLKPLPPHLPPLPYTSFFVSGLTQVLSKTLTSLSLISGLSFPIATLCKSAKMAPVMLGSVMLGRAEYSVREYIRVGTIILGTLIVGLSTSSKTSTSTTTSSGLIFILGSLACDGLTGGIQKSLKEDMKAVGRSVTPYQFMLYTNLSMSGVAFFMCIILGELTKGLEFISTEKEVKIAILRFAACSAMGQSFIFYAIANFDPLMCTTITTTRKIFSVLLSLLFKGHNISGFGWLGILLASGGVMSEVEMKRKKGEEGKRKKFGVEMKGEKFREEESQSLVMGGNTTGTMSRRSSTDLLSDSKSDSSLI